MSSPFGFANPSDRWLGAVTSFAQLRRLVMLTVLLVVAIVFEMVEELSLARIELLRQGLRATPDVTLYVLRSLPLLGGVSPAAPTLLCAACIYVWAAGRMARLYSAHRLSRISPADRRPDLVSTPISLVLYPDEKDALKGDEGMTAVERRLVNAIWRPSTGPAYFWMLAFVGCLPLVLFRLKPLSTLEDTHGSRVLTLALSLSAILIGATFIQLWQYWFALEALLKRTMEHRLGTAFANIAEYAHDSLVDQLSRPPSDVLRLVACAQDLVGLTLETRRFSGTAFGKDLLELEGIAASIATERTKALESSTSSTSVEAYEAEANLGVGVVQAAMRVACIVRAAWDGKLPTTPAPAAPVQTSGPAAQSAPTEAGDPASQGSTALASVAWLYRSSELAWLRRAESFVATVVALLISRHVRQFRAFIYTLTGCALLLLLAMTSYPFEPHRLLLTCIWVVMGSIVMSGLWVYLELDQNTLMSHIAGTPPGKLTLNGALAARVVAWVVLPLLGVAAAQYPEIADVLLRIVEPFARALK